MGHGTRPKVLRARTAVGEARRGKSSTPAAAQTRERLLQEALRLLATQGLQGASLRRIVQASGAANPSALHYHFGGREGLIAEIAGLLSDWLEPRWLTGLQALTQDASRGKLRARKVIEALVEPVLEMLLEPTLGRHAVLFIGRLGWEFGIEGQDLSARMHRLSLEQALVLLKPLLPGIDEETLKFHLVMGLTNIYHGLAYRSYLWRSPFGPLALAKTENATRLKAAFVDYLEGGVTGAARR